MLMRMKREGERSVVVLMSEAACLFCFKCCLAAYKTCAHLPHALTLRMDHFDLVDLFVDSLTLLELNIKAQLLTKNI